MDKSQWFAQTLRTYEKNLVRFASKKVSLPLAHEMVQECFLRLWSQSQKDLQGREGPWLYTVTRNLCLDHLKREATVPLDAERVSSGQETALQEMENAERESQIMKSMKNLNEAQQEVLRLKFQDGFSYKEISEITGHSISYVGVLIHEGITQLRKDLAEDGKRTGGDQ